MKIAILGATSEIAKDLIRSWSFASSHECVLFARRPDAVLAWQIEQNLSTRFPAHDFGVFATIPDFDAIINFVGVGNPAVVSSMGASILETTAIYDELALCYIRSHPACRYIFLSSGAVYGENFDKPASVTSQAVFPINSTQVSNWYSIAKFYAEMRHRALPEQSIIDIRIFNYISRYQDLTSRFMITEMIRAVKESQVFKTTRSNIIRDYLSPSDFIQLITIILSGPKYNGAMDCFTKAPIDKYSLLDSISHKFGLRYEFDSNSGFTTVTGLKANYYSINRLASEFGYIPQKTALESVIGEVKAMLNDTRPGIQNQ